MFTVQRKGVRTMAVSCAVASAARAAAASVGCFLHPGSAARESRMATRSWTITCRHDALFS